MKENIHCKFIFFSKVLDFWRGLCYNEIKYRKRREFYMKKEYAAPVVDVIEVDAEVAAGNTSYIPV